MILFLFFLKISLQYSIAPAIIAAGIGAVAGGAQSVATGKMNRKSRRFQREMFDKTNKYNSPLEQRKRLEEAGLNPNLVYGSSSGGVAGTASQPSKPDFDTPEYGNIAAPIQTGVMDYYNAKSIQAGTDVNEAREENIKQDTVNKGIDSVNKAVNAASGQISLKQKRELYENTINTAKESLRSLSAGADYTEGKNSRENRITNETVSKLKAETANLRTQGKKLSDEAIMTRLDRILYQDYKVRPSDPFYFKIMGRLLEELKLEWNTGLEKTINIGK